MGFSGLVQDDLPWRPSAEVGFGTFYSTATVAHAALGTTTFAGNLLRTTMNIETFTLLWDPAARMFLETM